MTLRDDERAMTIHLTVPSGIASSRKRRAEHASNPKPQKPAAPHPDSQSGGDTHLSGAVGADEITACLKPRFWTSRRQPHSDSHFSGENQRKDAVGADETSGQMSPKSRPSRRQPIRDPASAGTDGDRPPVTPTSVMPRQSKKRAVQYRADAHACHDSTTDRTNGRVKPTCSTSDPVHFDGQLLSDPLPRTAVEGDHGAHHGHAPHRTNSPVITDIVQMWRMRQRWHRAEKRLVLQAKGFCRALLLGDKAAANELYKKARKGEVSDPTTVLCLLPFLESIKRFEDVRLPYEKDLRTLAMSLPVWPWVKSIHGFGPLNLAGIVGESGDIGNYRTVSCLWKRMGLAVIDGGRQRKVSDLEQALTHGYSPSRRSVAYLLGDTMVKAGEKCQYRPDYTKRRARTDETHPDWNNAHQHNDAARIMTKSALRDLWVEWRKANRETGQ